MPEDAYIVTEEGGDGEDVVGLYEEKEDARDGALAEAEEYCADMGFDEDDIEEQAIAADGEFLISVVHGGPEWRVSHYPVH